MSKTIKLILPLCEKVVPRRFLTKEAGFVDAFTIDNERYYLQEHIILMYEFIIDNAEKAIRLETFRRNGINPTVRRINGKLYTIYVIRAATPEICKYRTWGTPPTNIRYMKKIIAYWKADDEEMLNYILDYDYQIAKFEDTFCPESDIEEEPEGITIQKEDVCQQ